jgi:hypothetical protein
VGNGGSRPAGVSIGRALSIPSGLVYDPIRTALSAVDSIHGDGNLPRVSGALRSLGPIEGRFVADPETGAPLRILINSETRAQLATLYELGHFLDYVGIGVPNQYASNTAKLLRPWRHAIHSTLAFALLHRMRDDRFVEVISTNGTPSILPVDVPYVDYLLRYNELWARSYIASSRPRRSTPAKAR